MKKVISMLLILTVALGLSACSGGKSDDPNVGKWNAVSASMMGFDMETSELFDNGVSLEIKANGQFTLDVDGEKASGKWEYDGDEIVFSSSDTSMVGTIENGTLILINLLDTGIDLRFEKEGGYTDGVEVGDNDRNDTANITGETIEAENISALVPNGWLGHDASTAKFPNVLQIYKGAKTEADMLSKSYIQIDYFGEKKTMVTPSKDSYEDVVDLEPFEAGGRTWQGFTATSLSDPFVLLWTGEKDGDQFQVTIWLEYGDSKISLDDADTQAIIESIAAK